MLKAGIQAGLDEMTTKKRKTEENLDCLTSCFITFDYYSQFIILKNPNKHPWQDKSQWKYWKKRYISGLNIVHIFTICHMPPLG